MTKDRLQELQEYLDKYTDGEDISMINHFSIINMEEPFMGDFFDQINGLRSIVNKIAELVDNVEHLQCAMLAPQAVTETKEKLEEHMTEIKLLGTNVRMVLKQMKQIQEMENNINEKNICQRIIASHIDALTKYFCTTMDRYYQSVILYRKRCKIRIIRQLQIAGIERTDDEIEEILQNGHLIMTLETIIETQQARQILDHMELRNRELIELEKNIRELHDMFLNLAYLVHSKADQINHIESKISDTENSIKQYNKTPKTRKVSHCFDIKLSKKRFISSLVLMILRLFTPCILFSRSSCS